MTVHHYPLNHGSRRELDLRLQVVEGRIPDDLSGHLFVNSVAGTVNYETPAPRDWPDGSPCPEHGATNANGDGMVYRIDFSPGREVRLKCRLLRTPCFYADEATRYGTGHYERGLHFISRGLSRLSDDLGARNQVNTALVAFRFGPQQPVQLAVTFDAGRPYLLDPRTLELISPVGWQREWLAQFPDAVQWVFPMIYATAHPCFDPNTYEFFTVNYQKSLTNQLFNTDWDHRLRTAANFLLNELNAFAEWVVGEKLTAEGLLDAVRQFIPFVADKEATAHEDTFAAHYRRPKGSPATSELRLVRWRGRELHSWTVVDTKTGVPIAISQTIHQMDLTEDFILISDSTLKLALDLLLSLPFGHHDRLNTLLRKILTHTIRPTTPCYIIRRADLTDEWDEVRAVACELPHETIHFSLDYRNPEEHITLYAGHNSATCGGEWVRPFDRLAIDPDRKPAPDRIGSMTTSVMDISQVGKHLIDGGSGKILRSECFYEKGFPDDAVEQLRGPHTWGAALHTYRDDDSAHRRPDRLRRVYQYFDGLDGEVLTKFVYDLYHNYNQQGEVIPPEKLLDYHRHGVPGCLVCVDTERMAPADHYLCAPHEQLQSLQFIPRRRPVAPPPAVDLDTDGYLAALMMVGDPANEQSGYSRQLYVFDAADLAAGPLCKLTHPDLAWGLTIHAVFCEELDVPPGDYRADVRKDYDWVLDQFYNSEQAERMRAFLKREVYGKF